MRRNWKWLVGIVLIVTLCVAGATFAASASGEKSLAIEAKTLSLENEVQIKYAVSETGFTKAENIHLLVWMSAQTDYTYGTQDAVLDVLYTDTVGEKKCVIFAFDGFSAKQMTDTIYTRAFGSEDGDTCYSDMCEYSILQYALNQLTDPETDQKTKNALTAMLDYGAAAQLLFNYKTDTLANAGFCRVEVVNGTFEDGFTCKSLLDGATVTLVADEAPKGMTFIRWENGAGQCVGTTEELEITVTENVIYTAVYEVRYSEGLAFTSNGDGTCYVSGVGTCEDTELVIPPTSPAGDTVTAIGGNAFANCSQIKAVEIPSSVTSIGVNALQGCSCLTNITIPSSVTSIGDNAFQGCSCLTNITISSSVTSIGEYAFSGCSSLTSVVFAESSKCTSIGRSVFCDCFSLTSITIPDSVTSIGNFAFGNCSSLTSVAFAENSKCTSIGDWAFYCAGLTSITIPDSVTSIGEGAFSSCSSLTSITIPDSVTSIGSSAFSNCPCITTKNGISYVDDWLITAPTAVTKVTIPEGTRGIAGFAFYSCSSLASITIPDSVASIGDDAFLFCSNLNDIVFLGTQEQWNAISKGNDWDFFTGDYTVHCTDGDYLE